MEFNLKFEKNGLYIYIYIHSEEETDVSNFHKMEIPEPEVSQRAELILDC